MFNIRIGFPIYIIDGLLKGAFAGIGVNGVINVSAGKNMPFPAFYSHVSFSGFPVSCFSGSPFSGFP